MVSSTELMKQAEHCGRASIPQLNQTGELKDNTGSEAGRRARHETFAQRRPRRNTALDAHSVMVAQHVL